MENRLVIKRGTRSERFNTAALTAVNYRFDQQIAPSDIMDGDVVGSHERGWGTHQRFPRIWGVTPLHPYPLRDFKTASPTEVNFRGDR